MRSVLFTIFFLVTFYGSAQISDTFNVSGNWTAPAGVTSIDVEAWGAGGAGGAGFFRNNGKGGAAGGGGGGGAYVSQTVTVVPGTTYTITVGAGGTGAASTDGTAGGASTAVFGSTTVTANGGAGGSYSGTAGTDGSGGTGGTGGTFAGGNGANGSFLSFGGGGGGSSAGSASTGNNGSNGSGGTAPANGGSGGNGGSDAVGNPGIAPGGGGGAGSGGPNNKSSFAGGNGGDGQVIITYNAVDPCDALASGNLDTDGDGVSDICDVDDDNDGILDMQEGSCEVEITPTGSAPSSNNGLNIVSGLYTDFNGYWESSDIAINPVKPDANFNLLAFTIGTTTYSTGVNNSRLRDTDGDGFFDGLDRTNDGIADLTLFESSWSALIPSDPITNGVRLEARNLDGNTGAAAGPLLTSNAGPYNPYLYQGPRGLDMAYGIANLGNSFFFNLESVVPGVINDGVPDLLLTQTALPGAVTSNTVYLLDENGNYLGDGVDLDWNSASSIGNYIVDQYNSSGSGQANEDKSIRMAGLELGEFNLTATEEAEVAIVEIVISANADISFLGQNEQSFSSVCSEQDTDGDGIVNRLDTDSDNDGTPDALEADHTVLPTNITAEGRLDITANGVTSDGIPNDANSGTGVNPTNSDGDSFPDYADIDSDNDGIADIIESQTAGGYTASSGTDTDGDGIDDTFDGGNFITNLTDTDNDGTPDRYDSDSDGDGVSDFVEAYDPQQDGIPTPAALAGADADSDGLDNAFDNYDLTSPSLGGLPGTSSNNVTNNGETATNSFPRSVTGTTANPNAEPNWRLSILWFDATDNRWEDAGGNAVTLNNTNFTDFYLVIDDGAVANINNHVTVNAIEVRTNEELEVSGCLEVIDYALNDGAMRLTSAADDDYGQYLGPGVENLECQMVTENSGWHNIALPVNITAADFDTENSTVDPELINLTGVAATHNLWNYNSAVSGGKEIGFYTGTTAGSYQSHSYGTWEITNSGTLTEGYNLFIGNANTGNATPTISATGTSRANDVSITTSNAFGGWNLIPNPFPVAIDFSLMETDGFFSDLDKAVWIWDPSNTANTQPGSGNGSYTLYDPITGQAITNGGDLPDNNANAGNIPPFQSFWVRRSTGHTVRRKDADGTVTAGATDPSVSVGATDDPAVTESNINVTVKASYRSLCVTPTHFKTNADVLKLRVRSAQGKGPVDETMLTFGAEYTAGLDAGLDIGRISANPEAPFIVSDVEGQGIAINRLPYPTKNTLVPLGFVGAANGNTYQMELVAVPSSWRVYLEDTEKETFTELTNGGGYRFNHSGKMSSRRFILHFNRSGEPIVQPQARISAWGTADGITVRFEEINSPEATLTISNLMGQVVYSATGVSTAEDYAVILGDKSRAHLYLVTVTAGNKTETIKVLR